MKSKTIRNIVLLSALCATVTPLSLALPQEAAEARAENAVRADVQMSDMATALKNLPETVDAKIKTKVYGRVGAIAQKSDKIISGYNKTIAADSAHNAAEKSRAKSVEYTAPVYIAEDKSYGAYIDFDGDNGYAVVSSDNKVHRMETSGDPEVLRDSGVSLYYSYNIGALMYKVDGEIAVYENSSESENHETDDTIVKQPAPYPGQDKGGDGTIENLDVYVKARYAFDSKGGSSTFLPRDYPRTIQWQTSYYYEQEQSDEHNDFGEGNCSLNAMYNVLDCWSYRGIIKFSCKETFDLSKTIEKDVLYKYYSNSKVYTQEVDGVVRKYRWKVNIEPDDNNIFKEKQVPIVYNEIRNYAIGKGYTVDGYNKSNVQPTLKYVANTLHGEKLTIKTSTNEDMLRYNLGYKTACYMSMAGSSTYENHGVAVTGYHSYAYEYIDDGFTWCDYRYFYEISDGWSSKPRYFDPNASNAELFFVYPEVARC